MEQKLIMFYVKGGQYPEYNRVDAQLVREYKDYFELMFQGLSPALIR